MLSLSCRVCECKDLDLILDLGDQPWGNGFLKPNELVQEQKFPLRLVRCQKCTTAQLDFTIPKEVMFLDHTYLSGTTQTLSDHFAKTAQLVRSGFFSEKRSPKVLDIGSNDGTQLMHYKKLNCEVLGVESATHASKIANENGIETLNAFFNLKLAEDLNETYDIISASGIFFHVEELHSVCQGISLLLDNDGVFVVQFIYMKLMQENIAFDQIYHEHLLYYNLYTINKLLNMHGLELFDAFLSPIHGGSVIGYVSHIGNRKTSERLEDLLRKETQDGANTIENYQNFARLTKFSKDKTLRWVENLKANKKVIFGLGAPVKGNTLLNYFQLGPKEISALVERNPLRRGLLSPGMHIPIVLETEVSEKPDAYLVLAWNYKDEILERHKSDLSRGIEFYFPVTP